jgi:sugar lactone lactonase YvrE
MKQSFRLIVAGETSRECDDVAPVQDPGDRQVAMATIARIASRFLAKVGALAFRFVALLLISVPLLVGSHAQGRGVTAPLIVITSPLTATATINSPFSYTITGSEAATSYNATGLPAGLSVNSSTGVISGTPTVVGTYPITISAFDASGTGVATLTLAVSQGQPAPTITSALTAAAAVNANFTYTIAATGAPTSYGATGLPTGLTLNTTTGVVSGSPAATGNYIVTISATNAAGTGSATLNLGVSQGQAVPAITSTLSVAATVNLAFSYTITATGFPSSFNATGLPPGLAINTVTGVISGTPTSANIYTVTISATNAGGTGSSSLSLLVSFAGVGPTVTSALTAPATVGSAFSYAIAAGGSPSVYGATGLPAGLTVNTTTGIISGVPTAAGSYAVKVSATSGYGTGSATLTLTVSSSSPGPAITSALIASGTVNSAFSYTITAGGSPTSYNATGLPTGLTVNTSTGVVSGTAATSGTYAVTISATNPGASATAGLTLVMSPSPYTFTTLAGASGVGSTDGTGSAARFSYPGSVAVDSAGNIYVADTDNATIRKVTSAGGVTTLAGNAGSFGSADGTGSAARFAYTGGVAVDSSGNVYVADTYNSTIRKITSTGVVTTLAGTAGSNGSADGSGSAARFFYPQGVAVDISGNLYVADTYNNTIRKITSAGVVTTLAGTAGSTGMTDATGSAARFDLPQGVAVDGSGNVYVADTYNHAIRKIAGSGVVTTFAGTAGSNGSVDGTGSAARFTYPGGVAVDSSGNVYVADSSNHVIRRITSAGVVTTLAGSAGFNGSADGTGSAAQFFYPGGVTVDTSGNVYVADTHSCTIRRVTSGGTVTTLAGKVGAGAIDATGSAARFNFPESVAVDASGNAYVADSYNQTIRKISSSGAVITLAGLAGNIGSADGNGSAARFNFPQGVTVDGSGNVYVADTYNHTIRKITSAGVVTTLAGSAGSTGSADGSGSAARFFYPDGLAADGSGNVYVADLYNHTIRKITSAGAVTTVAGSAGLSGSTDGTGAAARFYFPEGVAVDGSGTLYVADTYNNTIRKITSGGVVTTLAGLAGSVGSIDGVGNTARFNDPIGVAVDSLGNVYVADVNNDSIRMITSGSVVTTLGGSAGIFGTADGVGTAAQFNDPIGLAVSSSGNVYVADTENAEIRLGTPQVAAPTILTQPVNLSTAAGGSVTFSVVASGTTPITYQWQKNGVAISGATSASYTIGSVEASDVGSYSVVISNSLGSSISSAATLVLAVGATSRISNLSVRTNLASGQLLTVGFVTNGAKSLVLRADGPSLNAVFGLTGFYPDPMIAVINGQGTTIAQNDNWSSTLSPVFATLGAFPLTPGSTDAALQLPINGPDTAQINGTGAGVLLVEVYDADSATAAARLTNVSARNLVGTGANVLISGFVIAGTGPETVLIRGIGPALHDVFGVAGFLADPYLEIHETINGVDTVIASNDNWDSSLTATFDKVGAYHFNAGSKDAALLITLQPGVYTAQVSGVNSGTGDGVVEVYEVP